MAKYGWTESRCEKRITGKKRNGFTVESPARGQCKIKTRRMGKTRTPVATRWSQKNYVTGERRSVNRELRGNMAQALVYIIIFAVIGGCLLYFALCAGVL